MASAPSSAWPRHDGSPAVADSDYLAAPAPEIGAVRSAETNRTAAGFSRMDSSLRSRVIEVGLLALALTWFALAGVLGRSPDALAPWSPLLSLGQKGEAFGAALAAGLSGAGATIALRRRRATFVGALGLQTHTAAPWGGRRTEVLRFSACAELRVEQTRHLLNGAYNRTTFRYAFVDGAGRPGLVIAGHFDERAPKRSELFRFAVAAEQAWNRWKQTRPGLGAA